MKLLSKHTQQMAATIVVLLFAAVPGIWANGGPFILKYPDGDASAKGVLARLAPDLRPGTESRLRVIHEDLNVRFQPNQAVSDDPPLVEVSAAYLIENPTDRDLEVDFGFPILRGVYVSPGGMMGMIPQARVMLDDKYIPSTIISNSAIYGVIRQQARDIIESSIAAEPTLSKLAATIREGKTAAREQFRRKLYSYLIDTRRWKTRDAWLMVEYAGLDLDAARVDSKNRGKKVSRWASDIQFVQISDSNLGPLAAIGEQKATQFLARLASCFDASAAGTYEGIFTSWGGDVRELSLDVQTGTLRPREIDITGTPSTMNDPTVYARVDYLDDRAQLSADEKAACQSILKNLEVIFTFAPMNLLHYRATFPANQTRTLTVHYRQHAFLDTKRPATHQFVYVLHPASLWKDFGPINLAVTVPEGVALHASVPVKKAESKSEYSGKNPVRTDIYRSVLSDKRGELYLAINQPTLRRSGILSPLPLGGLALSIIVSLATLRRALRRFKPAKDTAPAQAVSAAKTKTGHA